MSHELRTPLTSVLGYTELLLSGSAGDLAARQRSVVDAVDRNAQRLHRFVDDLLLLLDDPAAPGRPGVVCLRDVAVDVLAAHRKQIGSRELDVTLTADGPDTFVRADRCRLQRAVSHLVGNAVKFTPSGGSVSLEVGRVGRIAVVRVRDTGVGIPPDELPLVFDHFFRTSVARHHATQGAGIGLTIARAIIGACGGTLGVRSEQGHGTVATARLPALGTLTD